MRLDDMGTVASVRPGEMEIRPGVGCYRMVFTTEWTSRRRKYPVEFHELNGHAWLATGQNEEGYHQEEWTYLAELSHEGSPSFSVNPGNPPRDLPVFAEVGQRRMEELRNLTTGDGFKIKLSLSVLATTKNREEEDVEEWGESEVRFEIPQSKWIKKLRKAGFQELLLLEVPVPSDHTSPELNGAVETLQEAQSLLGEGNYPEAVAKCRIALESAVEAGGIDLKGAERMYKEEDKEAMPLEERENLALKLAMHYMHPAHHPNQDGVQPTYSFQQASLAIRLTGSFLSSLVNRNTDS